MRTVIFIILVIFSVSFGEKSNQNVNIFDALKNNQVQLTAVSNSSYSGGSIIVEIQKLKNLKSVFIPSGTRFKSESGEDQDLINVDAEIIVLKSNSTF